MAEWLPIVLETRMSDYGFWVVTLGVASGRHVSMMICEVGISPMQAQTLALSGIAHVVKRNGAT